MGISVSTIELILIQSIFAVRTRNGVSDLITSPFMNALFVLGKPQPLIAWYFNGEQITPTRKFSFNEDNSLLTIYPYQQNDVGK